LITRRSWEEVTSRCTACDLEGIKEASRENQEWTR